MEDHTSNLPDVEVYIFASIEPADADAQMYILAAEDRKDVNAKFKALDEYKSTLATEGQERLNLHIWGGIEYKMLVSAYGASIAIAPSVEWLLKKCRRAFKTIDKP